MSHPGKWAGTFPAAERLRAALEKAGGGGASGADLARALGVSRTRVYQIVGRHPDRFRCAGRRVRLVPAEGGGA